GAEPPARRGWIIRSGQTSVIQIASPDAGMGASRGADGEDEEDTWNASALDAWVELVQARYPGNAVKWCAAEAATATVEVPPPLAMSKRLVEMGALARRASQWELRRLAEASGVEPVLTTSLATLTPESWAD